MKNPLESIWGTIISGVILTAVLYVAVAKFLM
jgi:YbbR domain-containing protein